jgi:hypothetical protein
MCAVESAAINVPQNTGMDFRRKIRALKIKVTNSSAA